MISAAEIKKQRVGKYSISTSLLIRAALAKGFECTFLPEKVVLISNGKTAHYFKGTSLPCNDAVAAKISHNKYFLRKLLKDKKLPAPHTLTLRTPAAWRGVLNSSLQFPLVVKPTDASHANGASLYITTPPELQRAVVRAFAYIKKTKRKPRILVEEYFAGADLRLFVVGNQVVSTIRREPAYIIGDGQHTIRQLIASFNQEWRSPIRYDFPMCPMPINSEVKRYLAKHSLTLTTILPAHTKTYLRWNANVSTGGRAHDISTSVHPRIKALAVKVARLSQLNIGGVDILCKDPTSADISSANVSILEINDSPGVDIHHFPFEGQGRDISTDILTYIFGTSPRQKKHDIDKMLKDLRIDPALALGELIHPASFFKRV